MLADMYSAAGRPEQASDLLGRHLDQPFDWIAYAKHLLIAGRREESAAALQEAERRSHQDDRALAELALARADSYRAEGRFSDAEAALQQGLDRGADSGMEERLELTMASLLLDGGRRREAIARLRRVRVGLARNRIVHGVLAARAGDLRTAGVVLERLVQEADERGAPRADARVHQLRAEIALARGLGAEAHVHAALAVRAFSTSWTLETLARAQHAAGKVTEAIETWTTILHRPAERTMDWDAPAYSQFVLAHYELARALDEVGRADEAHARYVEFLRFWERADPALAPLLDARARRLARGQGAQSMPAGRVPNPAA
jgi:tetratricopeptide (TPR) repeat protein